ncbi:MAG: SIR2 family protein [Ignavibacteriaceae bacterium]
MGNNNKELAFLFGAGVSIPAGFLSTSQLTKEMLTREDIIRIHGGGGWTKEDKFNAYPKELNFYADYNRRIKQLFIILENYFSNYFDALFRKMSYEDYYYIIDSINSDESGNYENSIVDFFSRYLEKMHPELFKPLHRGLHKVNLIELTTEAKEYIHYSVADNLYKEPTSLKHFDFLNTIARSNIYGVIHLFTLNHDILLENYLDINGIQYSDGFTIDTNGETVWNLNNFTKSFCIYKLHGSINWIKNNNKIKNDYRIIKSFSKVAMPLILLGTFNKLSEYSRDIAFELQHLFYNILKRVNTLIISGYSLGDQGINSRIIDWHYKSSKNKIILIHPKPDELKKSSRSAFRKEWDKWIENNTLQLIPKSIQNISWEEIKTLL